MMRRVLQGALVGALVVVASAHVGSPTVIMDGRAGPYPVRVVVRPPSVVPGLAQVVVRVQGEDVTAVSVRPVFWRTGTAGAPAADAATPVPGDRHTYTAQLWLMARGAYSVDVFVQGARGSGHLGVPVESVATGRLALSPALGAVLVVLGFALCAGFVTIIYKAAGESLDPVGAAPDPRRARRARFVALASLPVLALALFGGATWWNAVDRDYAERMYRPLVVRTTIVPRHGTPVLRLEVIDPQWRSGQVAPLMPDHGKLMHMALVGEGPPAAFAHLHPVPMDSNAVFETPVPPLPAGTYRVFADVVHETGFERTLVSTVTLPAPGARAYVPGDPDDAWIADTTTHYGAIFRMTDGATLTWLQPPVLAAGLDVSLRFRLAARDGKPIALDPYMGMAGHAMVVAADGSVFVHLHPMGTATTAAVQAFDIRDRGDTTAHGRLRLAGAAGMAMPASEPPGEVVFPFVFPKPGDYRIFVQVKSGGRIRTGVFDVAVPSTGADTR